MTHESDVVWLLLQAARGLPPAPHPLDGRLGLDATLEAAGDLLAAAAPRLRRGEAVVETFDAVTRWLMAQGSAVQRPFDKPDVRWLGDKKPVQHADPEVLPFLERHFPRARYLHVVRHPAHVVASMQRRAREGAPVAWWSGDHDALLRAWCRHEQWVLDASPRLGQRLLTVRYEDLLAATANTLTRVLAHLGVDPHPGVLRAAVTQTRAPKPLASPVALDGGQELQELLRRYGYADCADAAGRPC